MNKSVGNMGCHGSLPQDFSTTQGAELFQGGRGNRTELQEQVGKDFYWERATDEKREDNIRHRS